MEPRTKPQNMQYLQGVNASGKKERLLMSTTRNPDVKKNIF